MKGFQIKHTGQIKWEKKGSDLDMWWLEKKVRKLKEKAVQSIPTDSLKDKERE